MGRLLRNSPARSYHFRHTIITYTSSYDTLACTLCSFHVVCTGDCGCPQEPDVFGMRWEPAGGKPGYADLCIKLMDAAYPIVPGALFFVEGTAQYAAGYNGLAFNYGKSWTISSTCIDMHQQG